MSASFKKSFNSLANGNPTGSANKLPPANNNNNHDVASSPSASVNNNANSNNENPAYPPSLLAVYQQDIGFFRPVVGRPDQNPILDPTAVVPAPTPRLQPSLVSLSGKNDNNKTHSMKVLPELASGASQPEGRPHDTDAHDALTSNKSPGSLLQSFFSTSANATVSGAELQPRQGTPDDTHPSPHNRADNKSASPSPSSDSPSPTVKPPARRSYTHNPYAHMKKAKNSGGSTSNDTSLVSNSSSAQKACSSPTYGASPFVNRRPPAYGDSPFVNHPAEDDDSPFVNRPAENDDSPFVNHRPPAYDDSPFVNHPSEDDDSPFVNHRPPAYDDSPFVNRPSEDDDSPFANDRPPAYDDSPFVNRPPSNDPTSVFNRIPLATEPAAATSHNGARGRSNFALAFLLDPSALALNKS